MPKEIAKNYAPLDEKTVIGIYRMVDNALKNKSPAVENILSIWTRRKEAKGIETIQCKKEEVVKIAAVLRSNRLDIGMTAENGITALSKSEMIEAAVLLHRRHKHSPGDLSLGLNLSPSSAGNILLHNVEYPKNKDRHEQLKEQRKIEAEMEQSVHIEIIENPWEQVDEISKAR